MADAMLENRATVCAGNKEILCPRCDEPFVFGMKDNFHEFSIGLQQFWNVPPSPNISAIFPNFPRNGGRPP